jgi:hypothetical protein
VNSVYVRDEKRYFLGFASSVDCTAGSANSAVPNYRVVV